MRATPDWLRAEYLDRGRTQVDIAAELGVGLTTISRWLSDAGIRKTAPIDRLTIPADWLAREYVKRRRSVVDLADELGVSPPTVRRAIEAAGLEVRTGRRPAELEDRDWCARHQHLGLDAIALRLECRPELVRRAMQSHGLAEKGQSPYWQLADETWLRDRYIGDGMTHRQMAELIGCSRNAVTQALHRHGIPSRPTKGVQYPHLQDADWLGQQVAARRSMGDIAREIGCDRTAIKRALVRYGLR